MSLVNRPAYIAVSKWAPFAFSRFLLDSKGTGPFHPRDDLSSVWACVGNGLEPGSVGRQSPVSPFSVLRNVF